MMKESITNKQGITMIAMFVMGSTLVMGAATEAKQDAWLAIIIALILAIPVIAIYARILSLFDGKNLFEITDIIFGKIFGRIISLFFIWFSFLLGALVTRNFAEFIRVVSFPETPDCIPVILMGLLCIWVVREGIEVLGRWAVFFLPILALILFINVILSASISNFDNLRPVLYDGIKPVAKSAFNVFSFPLAETVVFMSIFNLVKGKNNPFKVYYLGLGIAVFFILITALRNILVLGGTLVEQLYFSSYTVMGLINIGDFLQRIEVSVSVVFLLAGFVKISICLLATAKGIDHLFKIGNYRLIVVPVGLMMMINSRFAFVNTMEMFEFAGKVFAYYAFPFQVILPIVIWIAAEIKTRRSIMQ